MKEKPKTLYEITQQALQILYKELGVENTLRFLNQFTLGSGDYTKERDQLFNHLSLDEIVSQIKNSRKSG